MNQFCSAVKLPIEQLKTQHVRNWLESLQGAEFGDLDSVDHKLPTTFDRIPLNSAQIQVSFCSPPKANSHTITTSQ